MLHRQQVNLAKFKRLVLHPAMIALCAADAVGYYATRARLDTVVPFVADPDYASAGARYAPSQAPIASFALPQQPVQADLVEGQSAARLVQEPDNGAAIAELAVMEPAEPPVADGSASDRTMDRAPRFRAGMPALHSTAEQITARTAAAAFGRAFPAHFAAQGNAEGLEVADVNAAADSDLAVSDELGDGARANAASAAGDQIEPERDGDVASGTELPAVSNRAQPNSSLPKLDPAPSSNEIETPVAQPSVEISPDDQIAAQATIVVPQRTVTAAAAVIHKVEHAAKRLSAVQPLTVSARQRANVASVSSITLAQHSNGAVKPSADPAPLTALAASASAGSILYGHVAVRLGDLLDAFEPVMDRAEFERLSRSPDTAALVTLARLRDAGIPVSYDAAEHTVAAAGDVRISAATLG